MSFIIIVGECGSGKTLLLSHFQYNDMTQGTQDYKVAKREIEYLQQVGYRNLKIPPQKHLCFSDYDFRATKKLCRYKISGYEIGLPNKHFKTAFFPVGSKIYLDEAQKYFDSRLSFFLREEVYRWFQLHRHNKYDVYLTAQRLANIDLNIRAIADKYIVIDDLDVKTDEYGRVVKITWKTRQFTSCETAELYQLSKERGEVSKLGKEVEISTDVNLFNCYDSYSNKPVFYDASHTKTLTMDYDYFTEQGYEFTLKGIVEFNNKNYFVAPKGYLKKQKLDTA